jgi:hypothetical protein
MTDKDHGSRMPEAFCLIPANNATKTFVACDLAPAANSVLQASQPRTRLSNQARGSALYAILQPLFSIKLSREEISGSISLGISVLTSIIVCGTQAPIDAFDEAAEVSASTLVVVFRATVTNNGRRRRVAVCTARCKPQQAVSEL